MIRPNAPRLATRLIDDVFDALDEQTVLVPGTGPPDILFGRVTMVVFAVFLFMVFVP